MSPDHLPRLQVSALSRGRFSSTAADIIASESNFRAGLVAAREIRAVIDRRYPLEQTVDAHRYVATGRKQRNAVVVAQ